MSTQPRPYDPLLDELPSRYVVGIDLGTTNCAVAYVDSQEKPWRVRPFAVPQLVAPAQVEARDTLPSFHYQPVPGEAAGGALRLPWGSPNPAFAVGFLARDAGTKAPGRLIASAKSWLCHNGVDRTAELLPWQGAADVERLSPVEATARLLRHIRDAWNWQFPGEPLARQDLVITLPASFDEVARELTVLGASRADLPRVVLIEEPQAAFYAWVYKHSDDWQQRVEPGQTILVCDIGGGTTDFTLIQVRASPRDGSIQFHRVAVGDHLILGGDNLDLALSRHVERKMMGDGKLTPQQWDILVRTSRQVKETLLGEQAPEQLTLHLPGSGSQLIGGGLQVPLERAEVQQLLLEGFLPRVRHDEKPLQRRSGFQEFGLPYAADPAITRYLAAFLSAHRRTADAAAPDRESARPDIVLFNGGFFASPVLRQRLIEVLSSWFTRGDESWRPHVLDNERLDLAVARGAAYYGMVRRGEGVRISANLARSYYIGVEHQETAVVCLVPGNTEPGQDIELTNPEFQLTISAPVEFPLFVSSTRLTDRPGEVIALDREQMTPLPPIRTVLRASRRSEVGTVPVHLHARLTEIGTIDLWCSEIGRDRSWRLQFDVRSTTQTDLASHESAAEEEGFIDEARWQACRQQIAGVFDVAGSEKPASLMKGLAATLEMHKNQWPTSLLRRMWESLMDLEAGRHRSAAHEARWLNLAGFALRPGYGFAVDDWRVAETWRTVCGKLAFHSSYNESLVLWRRVAGGLSHGQQLAIAEPLLAGVRGLYRRTTGGKGDPSINPSESLEIWRLLGSLELLDVPRKVELGNAIVELLPKRKFASSRDAMLWTLGRLGQRVPVYGPLNTVVPCQQASSWLEAVMHLDRGQPVDFLAAMQLARRTGDRHRDLTEALRQDTVAWLQHRGAAPHLVNLVRDGGRLDEEERDQVFGESLPKGLRISAPA